jgi:hypothetical protein
MRDGIATISNDIPSMINADNDVNTISLDRLSRRYKDIVMIDDNNFGPAADYDE